MMAFRSIGWALIAALGLALPAVGQESPQIEVTCSADNSAGLSNEATCSWIASGAAYVLVPRITEEPQPLEGTVRLHFDGTYFFLAVADSGSALSAATLSHTLEHRPGGAQAMVNVYAFVPGVVPSGGSFRGTVLSGAPLDRVTQELLSVLHDLGFLTEVGAVPSGSLAVKTKNMVYHDSVCDPARDTDCDRPARQRRVERQVGLAIELQEAGSGYLLDISPVVISRYRREGGAFKPDPEASAAAIAFCRLVVVELEKALGVNS